MTEVVQTSPAADGSASGRLDLRDRLSRSPASAPAPRRPRGLFRKYVLLFIGLVGLVLLANGAIDFWFSYQQSKAALFRIQQEKANSAARRIDQFVEEIERQIGWTTPVQWAHSPIEQRRFDFVRLLRQVPAIASLSELDDTGREVLRVSRAGSGANGGAADFSQAPQFTEALKHHVWFSPVHYRGNSEPYLTMAIVQNGPRPGVVVAEVDLNLVRDVIAAVDTGQGGYAYIVDRAGRLVAQPGIGAARRGADLSRLRQVAAALSHAADAAGASPKVLVSKGLDGKSVLSAHAAVAPLGWLVFVEAPLDQALAPLYGSALRTAALLGIGLISAILAALIMTRRIIEPIRLLEAGAARIGAGELARRIDIRTGDELEGLARQFNRMASDLQESYAGLERKVEERTAELSEALDQQTATAEVLQTINSSPGNLAPVFDAMLDRATRLCEAAFGVLLSRHGGEFRTIALHGVPAPFADYLRQPLRPDAGTPLDRLMRGETVVQLGDSLAGDLYRSGNPLARAAVDLGGVRTVLFVPLRKDDTLLGVFTIYRQEVHAFSEKQIGLVQNFAAQAVIAMENVRLITELRESLEYQTAVSEVLKVISRSTANLDAVLQAVVTTAVRLCRADYAVMYRNQDGIYRSVAGHGLVPEYDEIERGQAIRPGGGTLVGRVALEGQTVQIADAWSDPLYEAKDDARTGNVRSMLGVPLLREGTVIGVIGLARGRTDPYSEREVQLVTTFADQSVIAIENARLFSELRARTGELARSVEELRTLNEVGHAVSSTLDLRTVLATVLARSVKIADADAGAIFRFSASAHAFRLVEAVGWDDALTGQVRALRVAAEESAMGEAAARRTPVQIADVAARPSYPLRNATLAAGFRAALVVPLMSGERTLGAMLLERRATGEFASETVRLMQTLASQSVLAIQNARLFREIAEKSEQLEMASQHKSQFLANMSHELRTPLNAILGYAELLVDGIYGELADKPRGVLERIQNNGKHLLALINDVLDLAKIEAGQLTLTIEDYALGDVVRTVVSATEPLASSKGVKYSAVVPEDLPMAHGDSRRISQVLLNLVGNAIKFTDEGEVEIRAVADKGHFILTVRDTGPGIAPENLDRIFGEFQQVDDSNTRKKGGTGLGLAISKRMVEMQGGTISVESVVGQGSTFRVVLPVHVEALEEAA